MQKLGHDKGSSCSTATEKMPHNQEAVGSDFIRRVLGFFYKNKVIN